MKEKMLLGLIALAASTVFAGNLLVDPSFENGSAAWVLENAELVNNDIINGTMVCATKPGTEASVSQTAIVQVGKSYVLMAWIKIGEWGERGVFEVKVTDDETISQEITQAQWHLYAVPFVAKQEKITAIWRLGANTKGSQCDMFALSEYEELLVDPSLEEGGTDLFNWNMWNWGAELSDWEPRTGTMGMKANAEGGGGFGYYPDIFEPGEIFIAAAWIRTGENSLWYPGFRDHVGWTNLGWWAVRKELHVTEINIELSDIGWNQYVIPYKIPLDGFNPEVLWWQNTGETESYLDDLMLFRSPYKDYEIPWNMIMNDAEGIWNIWPNPDDPTWPLTPEVSVKEKPQTTPESFQLHQNYPNPFNAQTEISFDLHRDGHVTLAVYDLLGREKAVVFNGWKSAGSYSLQFDAEDLVSGIYLYKMIIDGQVCVRKMILSK